VSAQFEKVLILDGISGIPLGREICENLCALGIDAVHFDCLKQRKRPLHEIRSAYAKLQCKQSERDGFYYFPAFAPATLEGLVSRERPSSILVVGFAYKFFDPVHLRRISDKYKAGLFLYDTDSCNLYAKRREFIFFLAYELPVYERLFSFSQVVTQFLRETRKLDAVHLPYGAPIVPTAPVREKTIDVLFVGSCDLRRIFLLEKIRDNVFIRGNRWQRNFPLISEELRSRVVDEPVWGDELQTLLASAKIVLNIARTDFYGNETGINLRLFEAVAAGCFLLTDYCEEVFDLFEVGQEIEVFRSSRELSEKVHYYLGHDAERLAIARRGNERFRASHTWRARIEQLISLMNILA
jgi:spore maturation protein CgeB